MSENGGPEVELIGGLGARLPTLAAQRLPAREPEPVRDLIDLARRRSRQARPFGNNPRLSTSLASFHGLPKL